VHGVDQAQAFLDARFLHRVFDVGRDVDELHALLDIENELFGQGFHRSSKLGAAIR
jgi:hypothetical protein